MYRCEFCGNSLKVTPTHFPWYCACWDCGVRYIIPEENKVELMGGEKAREALWGIIR